MSLEAVIRTRLESLAPTKLDLRDESAHHVGHAGAASGGGHFRLSIVSAYFSGLGHIARHRMVYAALQDLMPHTIHALAIDARAPDEADVTALPDVL